MRGGRGTGSGRRASGCRPPPRPGSGGSRTRCSTRGRERRPRGLGGPQLRPLPATEYRGAAATMALAGRQRGARLVEPRGTVGSGAAMLHERGRRGRSRQLRGLLSSARRAATVAALTALSGCFLLPQEERILAPPLLAAPRSPTA